MKIPVLIIMISTALSTQVAFAGQFVKINGERFCMGDEGRAYKYDYDWIEGSWGPSAVHLKGLKVYKYKNKQIEYFKYVKPSPASPSYGMVFENISDKTDLSRFIFMNYDEFSGAVGFTNQFVGQHPVDADYEFLFYTLSATYKAWESCH